MEWLSLYALIVGFFVGLVIIIYQAARIDYWKQQHKHILWRMETNDIFYQERVRIAERRVDTLLTFIEMGK